jgi:RNA polymerase subunit RPABC4/transcription elongation factor Spt4
MSGIKCSRCGTVLEDYGIQTLRIGGIGGEWSYIVGNVVEIEQGTLPVQIHICPKCGKIELSAVEQTAAILLSRKGFKNCLRCGKRIPLASEECQYCGAEQKKRRKDNE